MYRSLLLRRLAMISRLVAACAADGNSSSCTIDAAIAAPPSPIVCLLLDASAIFFKDKDI